MIPTSTCCRPQGVRLTPRHYAYLKISEGCNNKCSFCIIPSLRGLLASRPLDEVLREAELLVRGGVRELLVISQDTSAYGSDLRYPPVQWRGESIETRFIDMARALGELGVWVRLHYVYPYPHVDEVIPLMAAGKVLPYLDIPFQHASPAVLKRMRRPAHAEDTLKRIQAWRGECPELTLAQHFYRRIPRRERGGFSRCCSAGSTARSSIAWVALNTRPWRARAPMRSMAPYPRRSRSSATRGSWSAPPRISTARLARRVGKRAQVLIDRVSDGIAYGRTAGDAPEIDGVVRIPASAATRPGEFVQAMIVAADTYDLEGRISPE